MCKLRSLRALAIVAAISGSALLTGCKTDGPISSRALQPLSPQLLSLLERKGMTKDDPILVRIFKEESELEVWKQDRSGQIALLKSYPICRWSGELGPKIREGDRQAPEGFYTVAPGQMNPNSSLYLSFNLGYPNAYDQAHGRTGAHLMVHGDCSSSGCYSMTDEQISEIYALARESFFGGQQSFQVQAYPFRMTPKNMARHRTNPNIPFWRMLKEGYDHFEVTRMEPKVDVCEKRYVFNARAPANASIPLAFRPAGRCPSYEIPQEIASAVSARQHQDEQETAQLIRRGVSPAPIRTNSDGGMHTVFLAKAKLASAGESEGNLGVSLFSTTPGTVPPHVVLPREPQPVWAAETTATAAAAGERSATSQAKTARTVTAPGGVGRPTGATRTPVSTTAASPSVAEAASGTRRSAKAEEPSPGALPPSNGFLLNGTQPVVPAGAFEKRWPSSTP